METEEQDLPPLRRQNSLRRSLRSTPHRTYSVIVTEKERTLLRETASPRVTAGSGGAGFVKSMTRFYNGVFTESYHRHRLLGRAASFASPRQETAAAADSPRRRKNDSKPQPLELRGGGGENLPLDETVSPQLSPTWQSVRSQDSGFSDSGGESPPLRLSSGGGAAANNIEDSTSSNEAEFRSYRVAAGERLEASLGTVSSLQAGLRLKLEDEPRSLLRSHQQVAEDARRSFQRDCSAAGKLIHFINSRNRERVLEARSATPQKDNTARFSAVLSPMSSSTPLRAPLSAVKRRPERPQTVTCLSEAIRSPVAVTDKTSSRTTWLKDVKRRRRWSQQLSPPLMSAVRPTSPPASDPGDLSDVCCEEQASLTIIQHEEEDGLHSEVVSTPDLQQARGHGEASRVLNMSWSSLGSCEGPSPDPVFEWWTELLGHTEPECMTYLQSKPILRPSVGISRAAGVGDGAVGPHSSRNRIKYLLDAHQNIRHNIKVFKR
jgi:hypothetical protein